MDTTGHIRTENEIGKPDGKGSASHLMATAVNEQPRSANHFFRGAASAKGSGKMERGSTPAVDG